MANQQTIHYFVGDSEIQLKLTFFYQIGVGNFDRGY